ncbi:MAG: DNA polymerase III subunit delta' [Vicinamibacteria bacterium]|nr:DNA polymerase III subunit delta' [Vicinamibacteria bacterium]
MAFDSVLGHERLKDSLLRTIDRRRLPPALLFCGPDGVGKRTLALAVARGLLCARGAGEPCEACSSCVRIQRGVHPDVRLIAPERDSIKVERARDLVHEICAVPYEGRAHVFIIDDAHCLTEEAANALLKGLEEPPATSNVILVTASPQSLLPTIRSRCQVVRFSALSPSIVARRLQETAGISEQEARMRAQLGDGSLGAALALESEGRGRLRERLLDLLERVEKMTMIERLESAQQMADADVDLALTVLRSLLRDIETLRCGASVLLNLDVVDRLRALARGDLGRRALSLAETIGEMRRALRGNANRLMVMDLLLGALHRDVELHDSAPA